MEKETSKQRISAFVAKNGGYVRMKDIKTGSFRTSEIKQLVAEGDLRDKRNKSPKKEAKSPPFEPSSTSGGGDAGS